jgi:hypothetical protein
VDECSHQNIAVFLDLSVATVKNRLHAARSKLKERMLREAFHSHVITRRFRQSDRPSHRGAQGGRRGAVRSERSARHSDGAYCERPLRHPRVGRTTPWRRHRTRRRQITGRRHSARATGSVPGAGSNLARIRQRKFYGLSECPEPTRLMKDLQRKGANAAPRSLMSTAASNSKRRTRFRSSRAPQWSR